MALLMYINFIYAADPLLGLGDQRVYPWVGSENKNYPTAIPRPGVTTDTDPQLWVEALRLEGVGLPVRFPNTNLGKGIGKAWFLRW